ncbi:MAG: DUF4340 domain-containing protein [Planctomycetota bacterium]|jgi:hypothetical protein|nr:DUF4340 domain-containing protein [Planctomycetota bacterium]
MRAKMAVFLVMAGLVLAQIVYSFRQKQAASGPAADIPASPPATTNKESEGAEPAIAATASPSLFPGAIVSAGRGENAAAPESGPPVLGAETESQAADISGPEDAPGAMVSLPLPGLTAESVAALVISDPDNAVRTVLRRDPGGWRIASLGNARADGRKVAAVLDRLLLGNRFSAEGDAGETGLDAGFEITLLNASGNALCGLRIGLRPVGTYGAVFARAIDSGGEGPIFRLAADIRGDLDLWRNLPGEMPDSRSWLPARPLAFVPSAAAEIAAVFSGNKIILEKDAGGGWRRDGEKGDDRDGEVLFAWLADLARFRTAGMLADDGMPAGTEAFLALRLADTKQTRLEFFSAVSGPNHLARSSSSPGLVHVVPAWRVERSLRILEGILGRWSGAAGNTP